MRLPDLRTNYGSVVGFFSLVGWGSDKDEALLEQRAKSDKSSSFCPVAREVFRISASGDPCLVLDAAAPPLKLSDTGD